MTLGRVCVPSSKTAHLTGNRQVDAEICIFIRGRTVGLGSLVEVLRDPADQQHNIRLERLELDTPAEFNPDRFDADAVAGRCTKRAAIARPAMVVVGP